MLKRIGLFSNVKYICLVSQEDMDQATYEYSPVINVHNSSFFLQNVRAVKFEVGGVMQ